MYEDGYIKRPGEEDMLLTPEELAAVYWHVALMRDEPWVRDTLQMELNSLEQGGSGFYNLGRYSFEALDALRKDQTWLDTVTGDYLAQLEELLEGSDLPYQALANALENALHPYELDADGRMFIPPLRLLDD